MKENVKPLDERENLVRSDERLDDLQCNGLMVIQKKNGYRFSTDSVLLSNFVKAKPSNFYIDLCSGTGVVAILVTQKQNLSNVLAVEIQPQLMEMSKRSVEFNGQAKKINVMCEDLSKLHKVIGTEVADVISVNPPYNEVGETSDIDEIKFSTHEIKTNLSEVCAASGRLLKFGGKLYMVHRADRLADIMFELKRHHLEPKRIRVVYPKQNKEPNLVLVEAKKGAKSGVKIESPLILNNDDGTETDELKKIYNRK